MRNLLFYKYATWGLLILNLLMIAFFFLTKPQPPHKKGGPDFAKKAIDILKLDEQQHRTFLQSAKLHNQQMEEINRQQQEVLKPYFNSLINPNNNINADTLLQQVQQLERNKIESTYQHFKEVKSILTENQKADFNEFMDHALKIILLEKEKKPHPPKEF